jgi:SAM-dependent methyltransferase
LAHLSARLRRFYISGRLLDVGCGAGAILSVMARDGWQAEGTELSELAASRLRAQGHRVHVGELHELELPDRSYDVVILSEIIEHLLEPRTALACAVRLLRPGGALYLTTPNFDALSRRLLGARWRVISVPEHIRYFNGSSLGALLTDVGLRVVSLSTEGLSPPEVWATLRGARPQTGFEATEALRSLSARSGPLSSVKGTVNAVLRATRLGDTLKALAIRPNAPR